MDAVLQRTVAFFSPLSVGEHSKEALSVSGEAWHLKGKVMMHCVQVSQTRGVLQQSPSLELNTLV